MCIRDRHRSASRSSRAAGCDIAPVSYTHLDVYKRQPLVPSELSCLLDFKKSKVETCGAFRVLLEPSEFGMVLAIRLLKLIDKLTPRQLSLIHI